MDILTRPTAGSPKENATGFHAVNDYPVPSLDSLLP